MVTPKNCGIIPPHLFHGLLDNELPATCFFQEAFEEKCLHIQLVFDYFHTVRKFNDNVVSAARKDQEALKDKIISKGNELFGKENVTRHEAISEMRITQNCSKGSYITMP